MAEKLNKILDFLANNISWIILGVFIGISIIKGLGTWWYMQQPVSIPHLTYLSPQGGWWDATSFIGVFIFGGRLEFTIPWFVSGIYLWFWLVANRPCIVADAGGKE